MALQRTEKIGKEGMQNLVRYMMGKANQMYEGAAIDIFGTKVMPVTSNYQRSNDIRLEVLGKRMVGYLSETGNMVVNLSLAIVDEADMGYKFAHSMSVSRAELKKLTEPLKA